MNDNVKKILQYIQEKLQVEVCSRNLFEPLSEKEKLVQRIKLAKGLKDIGIEVPPDNIQIL